MTNISTANFSGVLRPHVSIDVHDITASVRFYAALFGVEATKTKPDYAKFELVSPALNFSMNLREGGAKRGTESGPERGSLNHLGIQVASHDDVLGARRRLEESGLATFDEMNVACCYARQDKIWVTDPDGNPWEIFTVTESDLAEHNDRRRTDQNAQGAQAAPCCTPTRDKVTGLVAEGACC